MTQLHISLPDVAEIDRLVAENLTGLKRANVRLQAPMPPGPSDYGYYRHQNALDEFGLAHVKNLFRAVLAMHHEASAKSADIQPSIGKLFLSLAILAFMIIPSRLHSIQEKHLKRILESLEQSGIHCEP